MLGLVAAAGSNMVSSNARAIMAEIRCFFIVFPFWSAGAALSDAIIAYNELRLYSLHQNRHYRQVVRTRPKPVHNP